MGKYEDYLKKKAAAKEAAKNTESQKPSNGTPSTANVQSNSGSRYENYLAKKQAAKEAGNNDVFQLGGKSYIVNNATGQASKGYDPYSYQKSFNRSVKDRQSVLDTGHETLVTDLGQSLSGGLQSWGANQLASASTLGLAYEGLKNKDNYYESDKGSTLWKMLNASSANTRAANKAMEGAKEGRGAVGKIVMDVGSQAVMNGIDAAIRSIPIVGQALGTASFMSRSFGGTAQQKRDEGKSIATQVLSGAISAGIEQFTESMSRISGVRNYLGTDTGWLDNAYNLMESSIAKKLGPVVAKMSTSMLSEGVEEIMSDILTPLVTGALESVTKDSTLLGDFEKEEWQSIGDIAYDGLIGALSAIGGGMVESTQALNTYKSLGSDNALYATAIRQQFESERAANKAAAKDARDLSMASLADTLGTLFNKKTGKSVVERASEAAGKYVTSKQAFKMLGEIDSDYDSACKEVAKKFADQSFANEVVNKDILEEAAYKYLKTGLFAEADFQDVDNARTQINEFAKQVIVALAEDKIANAKGTKGKAQAALYSSLLQQYANNALGTEQVAIEEEEITAPRSYRYTQEELEADRAAREAEFNRQQSQGLYDEETDYPFFTGEDTFQQEQAQETPAETAPEAVGIQEKNPDAITASNAAEEWVNNLSAEERNKLAKEAPEIWTELNDAYYMDVDDANAFNARRDALDNAVNKARSFFNGEVQDSDVAVQKETVAEVPVNDTIGSEQTETAEEAPARERTEAELKLSKPDLKKVDQLFDGTKKSLVLSESNDDIRSAIYSRARQEGREVFSKPYGEYGRTKFSLGDIGVNNGEQTVQSNVGENVTNAEAEVAEGAGLQGEQLSDGVRGRNGEIQERQEPVIRPKRVTKSEREYNRINDELNTTGSFTHKNSTYSFTDGNGKPVGVLVKNPNIIEQNNQRAAEKLTKLAGKNIKFIWFAGELSKTTASGERVRSGGVHIDLGNGNSVCICNIQSAECIIHETVHGLQSYLLYKYGHFSGRYFISKTVDNILGEQRVNDFFDSLDENDKGLYKDLDKENKFWEAFAYLADGDSFFTEQEFNSFWDQVTDAKWQDTALGNTTDIFDTIKKTSLENYARTSSDVVAESTEEAPTLNEFRKERGETKRENIYEQREGQDEAAKQAERLAMDDAEYNELRQADKAIPTQQQFERQKNEQPKATPSMSFSEADAMANRSFGEKGRVRATRVVEAFNKISSLFSNDDEGLFGAKGKAIGEKLNSMREDLINVNDGYGTVKDVLDTYKSWQDAKSGMSDYYSQEVADMFDQILTDAEEKGWTFDKREQSAFAQAYEEAANAMMANIRNVNNSSTFLTDLATEAKMNKLNVKADTLVGKAIQKFIRMQISTDTAMKMFGGFKGSGEFYKLGQQIKDSVTKRMTSFIEAQSYFDDVKKMDGFKEFADNQKTYKLDPNSQFLKEHNPLADKEFTLQQIVTMDRLFKTLRKTFEHSDKGYLSDRIKGFVIRDSKGNSYTVDLSESLLNRASELTAISNACDEILDSGTPAANAAKAYSKACDEMFKVMGKDVSAVKKALTGNGLSLIGENYTPVLWANEDGSPADFNFNDDDTIRPPSFLYKRTAKQGHLVVSDISYIVDKYIENASDYVGTAQMKDMLRRLNSGNSIVNDGKGLNSTLAENFGKEAGTWFNEYVKDLTEYGENDSIWAALRRNMQKGALIGSPSVMMKQTSSYWSAMGLLSPEALVTAYRWKVGVKAADSSEYNNLLKYRRTTNNIDPTLTEIIKGNNKYGKASNSKVFQLFTNGIAEQDFKTVDNLYTATVVDTYLKNQNRDASYFASEQFQRDIDSKFAEVMLRSQPMFDTELRAEYARTDNELVKMTSMFRTQQTQNLNLIATAIGEWKAAGADTKGEKAQVLRQTVAGQASAALSLALLSVAADMMLHGLKKYRGDGDDDDEEAGDGKIELQRILARIGLNSVEGAAGTVWFGDQVSKWLIDRMSGGETNEFYGLNMGPLTTFKNILDSLEYVSKSPTPSNIKNVATNISQLMGIPINNAYRIVNSAIMYTADLTGNNDQNYDDVLKMVGNRAKVNKKNEKGRNLLVESGMSKKEATGLVKIIDTDDDGLSKDDLSEYYIEHPEAAERVSILWDSMGWKTSFDKAKKNLDKKVVYNSNPLYAAMDIDESESVSKTELTDYALEHPDQYEELEKLYDEQGWKGSFKSAVRSAEQTKLKETAEDAFYDNDYNVLFESVSQMKNGKSWLNSLIKDEYDEYDGKSNPIIRYMIDAKRSAKEVDEAVEEYGATKFVTQYKALRNSGLAPSQAVKQLDIFDANSNGSITQQELADYYKAHKNEESVIAEFWKACGWSTSWKTYKKRKKLK